MRWVSLLLLAVLAACVSTSVSDLSDGRHHLAIRAQHSEDSYDLDRADAAQQADKYCRKSGQRVKIDRFDDQGPWIASRAVGVVFSCQAPSPDEMPHHAVGPQPH